VSLLKSHGQRRESILCGEGLAGPTRQQKPRETTKKHIINNHRTDIRKESFAIREVETWNRLSIRVKLTEKSEFFKAQKNNYGTPSIKYHVSN
jgi:hypothetical protein